METKRPLFKGLRPSTNYLITDYMISNQRGRLAMKGRSPEMCDTDIKGIAKGTGIVIFTHDGIDLIRGLNDKIL